MNKDLENSLIDMIKHLSATRKYRINVEKITFYLSDDFSLSSLKQFNNNDIRIRKMEKTSKNIECLITITNCISTKVYYLHKDSDAEFKKFKDRYSYLYEDTISSFNKKCKLETTINECHIYDNLYVFYALPEEMEFAVYNPHKGIPEKVYHNIDMEELTENAFNIFDTRVNGIVAAFTDLNEVSLMHDHASNLYKGKNKIKEEVNDIITKFEDNKEKLEPFCDLSIPLYHFDKLTESQIIDNFRNIIILPNSMKELTQSSEDVLLRHIDMRAGIACFNTIDEILNDYESIFKYSFKREKVPKPILELPIIKNEFLKK